MGEKREGKRQGKKFYNKTVTIYHQGDQMSL
jgi:hypothetical protein